MPRDIVFDVNETLLDLKALDPLFERICGEAAVRSEWFGQLLQSALVARPGMVLDPLVPAPDIIGATCARSPTRSSPSRDNGRAPSIGRGI